ncbi:hypothetical protein [Longimicrobium sp.]|jgi:hypothetical protein|uniref:hypothetical protein n=1 Tax=Longimicrobium sp. TaxID=2029185 RepID=UPI002EDB58B7
MDELTSDQIAGVLRRLTERTDEINAGILKMPGDGTIELVTVNQLNQWLQGLAVQVENGVPF